MRITDGQIDTIALHTAHTVEDRFAQHFVGGRTQRLARLQLDIVNAIHEAIAIERHQNKVA